jgi:hypothetical protein
VPQYWVVGATWGKDDQFERFIQEGYWLLGWDNEEQPDQAKRRDQIRSGDRIAIKRRNRSVIRIRAIGVVERHDLSNNRVYCNWLLTNLEHEVRSRGCFKSIHGPFSEDDWIEEVFLLGQLEHRLRGSDPPDVDDEVHFAEEGWKKWRLHPVTERNRAVVASKKAQAMVVNSSLDCEVCGFNFATVYGDLGGDFCEVHHRVPLRDLEEPVSTSLDDLAILCSNCHSIIHRTKPLMSVEKFRARLRS